MISDHHRSRISKKLFWDLLVRGIWPINQRFLRKDELLELQVIPGTRNRKAIILTEKGKRFVENTINKADEIEKNAFLLFNEEERELYLSLFRRHIDYLKNEEKRVLDSLRE